MKKIAIKIEQLNKVYAHYNKPSEKLIELLLKKPKNAAHVVLKDISFEVNQGDTVAIIGTNGAGKSTLLQCIAGIQNFESGTISVNGRLTALLELGAGFNADLTGLENIYVSAGVLGLTRSEIEAKLSAIIEFANIGDYLQAPVSTYSSGMYVRLAFAIASHINPEILIIDEALSVGDVFFQQKCNLYMKNELKDVTKLIVSHDLTYVTRMADKVILLHEGRVYFDGDPLNAVEQFLRLNQTPYYSLADTSLNHESDLLIETQNPRNETLLEPVDKPKLSGKLDAYFSHIGVCINEKYHNVVALVGDKVDIIAKIVVNQDIEAPIIGYFINDKFGTTICGETNREYGIFLDKMLQGKTYKVHLRFSWPYIKDDDYFLNFGLGSGEETFNHVIQCWHMNFYKITGITPSKSTHGIFNNKIDKFSFYEH